MQSIRAIAYIVIKETIRNRIYQTLFLFAVILIVSAKLFSFYTLGEEVKIIKDIGTGSMVLFNLIFVLFTASLQLPNEIEQRTIYTVLTNPIRRWKFLVGKFLGINGVLFLNLFIMTGMFFAVLLFKEKHVPWILTKGIFLIGLQCSLLAAICLALSTVAPYGITLAVGFALYLTGHLLDYLFAFIEKTPYVVVKIVCNLTYVVLPHFENFTIADFLVAGKDVSMEYVATVTVYYLLYASAMLFIAALMFARKEV